MKEISEGNVGNVLCSGKFQEWQRFKPVQTALAGGFLLMLSSGIHIGHGFFPWAKTNASWTAGVSSPMLAFTSMSWFMGVIGGLTMAPMTIKFLHKQIIYLIANIFVVLSAVLMISLPEYFYAVFFARFVAGIGHGLAYVVLVQHFGEICEEKYRGRLGTSLHLFFLKGGIISGSMVINFFSVEGRMDPNRFLGIMSLFLSCIAILMVLIFYKESIVTLIEMGREDEAIKTMLVLRRQTEETPEIKESFNQMKMMVAEDKHNSSNIFSEENLKALLVVTLLRIAFVFTFNYALKYIHIYMTHNSKSGIDYTFILNTIHTASTFAVLFTIDKGRRKHFLISACGTAATLIVFGSLRVSIYKDSEILVFVMFVLFEFFSAIGLGLTAHIYSTEAFATSKKPGSIAFTSIIEQCFQIGFIAWVSNQRYSHLFDVILLFTSGFVLTMITIYLFFALPETKNVSIRKARSRFLL